MFALTDRQLDAIRKFCIKWSIREFSLFGSILRDDFLPESDVDVLVDFRHDAPWSYWEWPEMEDDLHAIFARPIDLIDKVSLTNPYRRQRILSTARLVYAA